MMVLLIGGAFQGKTALAARLFGSMDCVTELHMRVREMLIRGEDPLDLLPMLRGKVVICDEIGCGIVPLDRAEEQWREAVGRLCCNLAAQADTVIRVTAGVPQAIKGEIPCM